MRGGDETWQLALLNRITLAVASLCVLFSGLFLSQAPSPGILACLLGLAVLAAVRWLGYVLRTYLLAVALAGVSFLSAWSVGMGPGALVAGILSICVAGVLLHLRAAVAFWLLTTVLFVVAFELLARGIYLAPIELARVDPRIPAVGRRFAASYFVLSSVIALGVAAVVQRLSSALRETRLALRDAEGANERAQREADAKEHALVRLVEVQKFEVLAQISASVAHNFNNSLQVIMADASAIEMASVGDRSSREIAGEILDMCRDSSLIARQLLTLGQRVVIEPRVTDLGKEIGSALRAAERLLPSTTLVEAHLPLGHFARVDRVQLKQAILNLAINAGHAMPQGGVLRVELFSADSNEEKLVVSDTGVGMDADTASKIFDPFFTTKGAQGTGLGLATVSAIMQQHGGRIEVNSQVNSGTRFELTFPSSHSSESESSEPSMLTTSLAGCRILVVDDDRRVLRAMQEMLVAFGAEVTAVDSAEKALGELHEASRPYNVLCTDAVMPGLPTRELIAQVRRDFAGLPILLCSAYVESDLLRRGVETRELPFLAKPFSAEQLVRKIQGLVGGARQPEERAV